MSHIITAAQIPDFQRFESSDAFNQIETQFNRLKATQVALVDQMRTTVLKKQKASVFDFSFFSYCVYDHTQNLTDDTLMQIFSRVHFKDMLRVTFVCQRFHKILKGNTLWRFLFKENSPDIYQKLNTSLDPEKWIALGKFNFALKDLKLRIRQIEEDHRTISTLNRLTLAAAAPIILQAASSLIVSGAGKLAAIREANILAQAQEYMLVHPGVTLEAAKKAVTNGIHELIDIMC